MNNYYVYRHIRLDTGQPFYIGVGQKNEAEKAFKKQYARAHHKGKSERNKHWINIFKKAGRAVEILDEGLERGDAFQKEIYFIALYGREDKGTGILCNWTDGGEGGTGALKTEEQKARMREGCKLRPPLSQEARDQINKSMLETVARRIQCVESGEVFNGRIEAATKLFPNIKSAHRSLDNSCRTGRPYKRLHFVYLDEGLESLFAVGKRGKKSHSVLDENKVSDIKTMFNLGYAVKEIAECFDVSMPLISSITRGLTWTWVSPEISRETKIQKRLAKEEVVFIKTLLLEGKSTLEVSKLAGVYQSTVQRIQSGKDHSNVGPQVPKGQAGKLSEDQVTEIKTLMLAGLTNKAIATKFDVNMSTIQRIKKGKLWGSVGPELRLEIKRGNSKLTSEAVQAIKALLAQGEKVVRIAVQFGVHSDTISRIKNERAWKEAA